MLARWFLALLLLVHPFGGLTAVTIRPALAEGSGSPVPCADAGACCPLCEIADKCPCLSAPESPEAPVPVAPAQGTPEPARMAPRPEPGLWGASAAACALPIVSARGGHGFASMVVGVGGFLSVICVWTT